MFLVQQMKHLDRERDEAVKVLEAFALAFADLSPEEIERETAWALAEVRAEQRTGSQELGDALHN